MEELRKFWAIAIYLSVMLAAFAWYQRFVLADSGVSYFHYGAALVEALILAKVILIGQALGLGRRFEGSRLIVPVMVKSVLFAIFTAVFALVEHLIEGLLHHETWNQIGAGMVSAGQSVILARTVMVVVTLVPSSLSGKPIVCWATRSCSTCFFASALPDFRGPCQRRMLTPDRTSPAIVPFANAIHPLLNLGEGQSSKGRATDDEQSTSFDPSATGSAHPKSCRIPALR